MNITMDQVETLSRALVSAAGGPHGNCYIVSEALQHLLGKDVYKPGVMRLDENTTHWYLIHKKTGEVLDATAHQFTDQLDYTKGRGCGFLTKEPSKRTKELLVSSGLS